MRNTSFPVRAALAGVATVLSACPAPMPPTPPAVPPVITSFSADQTQVLSGAAVKLSFTAERATEVTLLDQTGAKIPLSGDAAAGEATVHPGQTSFYVLRASGEGGRDSAFVQVAVNEGLRQVFLIAVPAEIDSGETVTVAWSALGGTGITLKDSSGTTLSMAESGSLEVTPARSTSFDLRATGLLGPLSATASVKVRPVIEAFSATPPAAKQGEKVTFRWKTAGAEAVKLGEATFGELVTITSQASVDEGEYQYTVPADFVADAGTLPDGGPGPGRPVPDNFPLRFTLEASTVTPAQSVSAQLQSYVRNGPIITSFDVPAFVTETKPATVRWTLANAHRAELLLDGALVFSTAPGAANGSFTIPAVTADVSVTLVAYDFNGLSVRQTRLMKKVGAPKVNTFTLTPNVASGGSAATATWTTMNATLLILRVKGGPAELESTTAAMISAGMAALHPGRTTTYVLEAYNDAGDKDSLEKTVAVTTPVTATATANPTAASSLVMLSWDVTLANPADVIGIPAEPPVVNMASTGFFDIHGNSKAAKLQFPSSNDATVSFTTGFGYAFPLAGSVVTTFSASTNGFVVPAASTYSVATNADLKGTMNLPTVPMLAPFWDDLDLGSDGAVEWMLDGSAFPRRLIVQWTKAHLAGEPTSELTFQVQLFESGELRYEYQTMQAMAARAQGSEATVGIWLGPAIFIGQHSVNTPVITEGEELVWFTSGSAAGSKNILVGTQSVNPGFFYKTVSGSYVWVNIPVRVFPVNSVVVNEVMPTPAAGVTEGQYIELLNQTGADVDLGGLEVSTSSTPAQTFIIPPGSNVAQGGYAVLGQTTVAANNGGAPVDVPFGSGLGIQGADTVSVKVLGSLLPDAGMAGPVVISSYAWGASAAGVSVQRDLAIGGGIPVCTLAQMYGTAGSTGTPGAVNESCFPYTLTSIPVAFEDVSLDGGPLLPSTSSWDDQRATVTLPAGFTYFGVDAGSIVVSGNGWLSTRPGESASGITNKTAPGSTTPVGVIAPFWDDLASNTPLTSAVSNIYAARSGNHHVVQWKKVAVLSDRNCQLDFEAKLFDNGVIEFHYGSMIDTASTAGRAAGSSATLWIEAPDGGSALPISINQPNLVPNTAYRFTPKP